MSRNALGKGLGALMGGQAVTSPQPDAQRGESIRPLPVGQIVPSPYQPRKVFHAAQLDELADSIKELGVIQPLIVRQVGTKYELIAGERRWQAAKKAGLKQVPGIVRKVEDLEVMEIALVENLQRADLNPIEEAEGYARLMETFGLTQEQVAQKVGKSRTAVTNALRLRNLAADVKDMLSGGQLSTGHAKVLLGLPAAAQQSAAMRRVVKEGMSVRETERLVAGMLQGSGAGPKKGRAGGKSGASADWRDLELRLQRSLGTKVRIVGTHDKGRLEVDYYNAGDLERLLDTLGVKAD